MATSASSRPLIFRRHGDSKPSEPLGSAVPPEYARGAFHELVHGETDADPWRLFWRARSQMALDEFEALPLLEEAHAAFEAAADRAGCGLCARTALMALNFGSATNAGLRVWGSRMCATELDAVQLEALDPSSRAWWLAGELAHVFADAATAYVDPKTLAVREALVDLAFGSGPPLDDDARLAAAMALLEYAEFEDDEALFDRVLSGIGPALKHGRGSPLHRGRVWHCIHRCAFSIGPSRRRGRSRIDVSGAESEALAIAAQHSLPHLEATVLAVRGFYANLRLDDRLALEACERLGQITDFRRPNAAAWYYFLRGQASARAESLTEALLFYSQATEAAARAESSPASQQTFLLGHAGMLSQLGHWDRADAIYANLLEHQSGRDHDITQCRRDLVAVQRAAVQDPNAFATLRSEILERASALRWITFYLATPRTTADFLAGALRAGDSPDFIAEVVRKRQLPARETYPREWPWRLRIEALGTFKISLDGLPISFGARPQKKPIDLLKLLVAQGPAPVAATTIIDALWPEADGASAKGSFDMALLRLRKLLGRDDLVRLEAGRAGLDPEQVGVDAWTFAADADATYGGTLFGDDPEEGWHSASRQRLRDLYIRRAQDKGEKLEGEQQAAGALALYEAALAHDPLAEVMTRGAMRCWIALGEPAQALRAFERCRERLSGTLGVAPSPSTRKLADSIRAP
jgi:LuxR family transcriptional regulator, maltose regulon positive regulatory protein